ncbi:MAG: T9SS type A sorting domain-containing protein, partial [Bacteroidota bacterium]
ITSLRLYDGTQENEFSTIIWDMKFSEIETKKLYFTCLCYGNSPYRGLTIYDVEQNKVIDDRFMNNGAASFTLFDEEQRMFLSLGEKEILNIEKGFIEYQYSVDSPNPGTWSIVLYSPINDLLVGRHGYLVSAGIYSKGTGIEAEDNEVLIAYPNPSSYLVHIPYVCLDTTAKCQILNTKGHVLDENVMVIRNDELQIDLSRYPTGTYFVKLYCGDTVKSYQIVKEG